MSKKTKERGVANKDLHRTVYGLCKKSSHTGNKPLVPHINDPNVLVTQKVRAAQGGKND